jgi:HEXXH motif-containing protein
VAAIQRSGLTWAFESAPTGVLVVLEDRRIHEKIESYSLLGFPGTIFTDWSGSAIRFGESILHEATHSWLNEIVVALDEHWPEEPTWYSPWRGIARPVFGILHAALSFSMCAQFWHRALEWPELSEYERPYCDVRLSCEVNNLRSIKQAFEQTLRHVRSTELELRLRREYAAAASIPIAPVDESNTPATPNISRQ